ncbi:hypothetical protein BDD12DRAFT_885923 [Trichophaea hybrida]|nr:hypothetical protein BDD12DRAFT_885923 [Trichophaea hybrida]
MTTSTTPSLLHSNGFTYAFYPGYPYTITFYAEEARISRLPSDLPTPPWPPPTTFLPPPRFHRLYRLPYIKESDALPSPPSTSSSPSPSTALLRILTQKSRAITLSPIPTVPLSVVLRNVRGGKIERITHNPFSGRTTVFFVDPAVAKEFLEYVNKNGGIPWLGYSQKTSWASFLPASHGGAEPVKEDVRYAIRSECAGRVLVVKALGKYVSTEEIRAEIVKNAGRVRAVFEDVEMEQQSGDVIVKMTSIGTTLRARATVQRVWGAVTEWGKDGCEEEMQGLREKWRQVRDKNAKSEEEERRKIREWVAERRSGR